MFWGNSKAPTDGDGDDDGDDDDGGGGGGGGVVGVVVGDDDDYVKLNIFFPFFPWKCTTLLWEILLT